MSKKVKCYFCKKDMKEQRLAGVFKGKNGPEFFCDSLPCLIEYSDMVPMKPIPEYGDLMTLETFIDDCKTGCLIDYDGHGYYSDGKMMSHFGVVPSQITGNGSKLDMKTGKYSKVSVEKRILKEWSHVVWFNR